MFLTQRRDATLPGVRNIVYQPARPVTRDIHHYLRDTEAGVLNAQAVARAAWDLKAAGFHPDVMVGHNGWGEIWYLKEVFPTTPLLGYFEFFYRLHGADVDFEPGATLIPDHGPRLRTKNLGNLLGLDQVDAGQCPTLWQKSGYPVRYHPLLHVIHEGIDTGTVAPSPTARVTLPSTNALTLTSADEVITYVARNLEPYRGFPSFLRSLPAILARRPEAQVVFVGGEEVRFGPPLPNGQTYRQQLLEELDGSLDLSRVHFVGKVPYATFLSILQISTVHVYLTYPFVLSWSLLEAMAAGCLVVASRTAPVTEVMTDGENGLLVDFFSPPEIAERVGTALSNREAMKPLRAAARQTIVERYDLHTICLPQQLALLERLRCGP
ncbi:MAG: glycosyltransferase [Burkholderiales bacterium]